MRSSAGREGHASRRVLATRSVAVGLLSAALLAIGPPPALGWGRTGHSLITDAAIDGLPTSIRGFFREHREYIVEHSVDPDLWRVVASGRSLPPTREMDSLCSEDLDGPRLDVDEGPRHYLDADALEAFPFRGIPRDFGVYRDRVGDDIASLGTGPWTIASSTEMLAEAMRNGDEDRILCRAAILAHYVADFAQPFHLTVNYNGQLSGLDGIHYRFESDLVDAFDLLLRDRVRSVAPRGQCLGDPVEAAFDMLVEGFPAIDDILHADLGAQAVAPLSEGERGEDNPRYIAEFWERTGEIVVDRITYGASSLAGFWMTAWDLAGRPDLSARPGLP